MDKKYMLLLLSILNLLNLAAQEDVVTNIRKLYTDYNTQLEKYSAEGLSFLPAKFEFKTVQNRPALGPVDVKFTYYYDEKDKEYINEEAEMPGTDGFLRKVVYSESMPSYNEYIEFFFDENGSLLFYYSKLTGYSCGEKRLYFSKGKMIKIKSNPLEIEDCQQKITEFTHSAGKFTKDDLDMEKSVLKTANQHLVEFSTLFQILH